MADNETPLGAPGGGPPGGPRSATAATFQVNDSSLRSLSKVFQQLTTDVGKFNSGLISLEKGSQTLDRLHDKLSSLGFGGASSGSGSGSSTTTRATTTKVGQPGAPAGSSTTTPSTTSAQLSGGGRGGVSFRTKAIGAGVGVAYAAGGYYKRSMGDVSDMDLMYTQSTLSGGQGFSQGAYRGNISTLQGYGGYQSASDLMGGVGQIQGALGAGLGNARTNRALQSVGQLSALNPSAGFQGSAAAVSSLYSAQTQNRMRSLGVTPQGSRGVMQTPQGIYQQIQRLVFRGQKVTADMIGEGMQPGAPLYRTLVGLGLDANAMEQFRMYALVQANLGGSPDRTNKALSDAAAGRQTRDTRLGGLDSIRSAQNRAGRATTNRTTEAMTEGRDSLMRGFNDLANVTNTLTQAFAGLNNHIGVNLGGASALASFLPGSAGGAKGALEQAGQSTFNLETIGGFFGGVRGGGGLVNRLKGGLKGGAKGALGASGLMGTPVYVTNMPGGGFGGGGGGGGGDGLPGGLPGEEGTTAGRFARAKAFMRSPRGRLAGRLGAGAAEGAAAGYGYSQIDGIGGTQAGVMGGVVGAVGAVNPLAGAIVGGVTVAGGHALSGMAHAGWFGATSNTEIAQKNAYANDGSLTGMLHRWASEGFSRLPDAQAEYEGTVRPLVMRSTQSRKKDDELKALHALAQLMAKYRSKLSASNNAAGRSDSGRVMFNSSAQQQMSYSVGQPGGATGAGGSANVASSTKPTAASSSVSGIISTAESFVGRPYKWGGSNPKTSFDCSGLMQWSFGQNGVKLPRTAAQQQQVGADVPLDQLVPGDLVFYGSPAHHVAMYIGNGQMVEAPHTGANIHNTKLRAPTNARRVAGGGAGLKGVVSAGNPAAQGDSGTGPVTRSSANLSSVFGFGDEQSALASVLTPPSLFGGDFGGGRSGAGGAGSGRTTTSQSAGTPTGPPPGGTVGSWVKTALGLMHLDFGKYGGSIASIIQHESGGNPHAQNNWDSNAKAGHPSKGLMQTIDSTFSRWALPGHGDIWNPVDNIIAGTRYAMGRYGSLDNVPGIKSMTHGGKYKGYAQGSYSTAEGLAYLHNDEMVVPAQEARKVRAMIARKGQRAGGTVQSHQGSGGSGLRDVTIQAPITVVGKATQKDAQDFLSMVKDEIEQNHALESVGSG